MAFTLVLSNIPQDNPALLRKLLFRSKLIGFQERKKAVGEDNMKLRNFYIVNAL